MSKFCFTSLKCIFCLWIKLDQEAIYRFKHHIKMYPVKRIVNLSELIQSQINKELCSANVNLWQYSWTIHNRNPFSLLNLFFGNYDLYPCNRSLIWLIWFSLFALAIDPQ